MCVQRGPDPFSLKQQETLLAAEWASLEASRFLFQPECSPALLCIQQRSSLPSSWVFNPFSYTWNTLQPVVTLSSDASNKRQHSCKETTRIHKQAQSRMVEEIHTRVLHWLIVPKLPFLQLSSPLSCCRCFPATPLTPRWSEQNQHWGSLLLPARPVPPGGAGWFLLTACELWPIPQQGWSSLSFPFPSFLLLPSGWCTHPASAPGQGGN